MSQTTPHLPMLEGKALVDFVAKNEASMTQNELAREAGYTREAKNGKTHVLRQLFVRNYLLATQGTALGMGRSSGNSARYVTTVHANGIALVGKTYIEKFGLEPGDKLKIQLDDDCIRLMPCAADEESDEEACAVA
jgi:hypothetical protein